MIDGEFKPADVLVGPKLAPDPLLLAQGLLNGPKVRLILPLSVSERVHADDDAGDGPPRWFLNEHRGLYESVDFKGFDEATWLDVYQQTANWVDNSGNVAKKRSWIMAEKLNGLYPDGMREMLGEATSAPSYASGADVYVAKDARYDFLLSAAANRLASRLGLMPMLDSSFLTGQPKLDTSDSGDDGTIRDESLYAITYSLDGLGRASKRISGERLLKAVVELRRNNAESFGRLFNLDAQLRQAVGEPIGNVAEIKEERLSVVKEIISQSKLLRRVRREFAVVKSWSDLAKTAGVGIQAADAVRTVAAPEASLSYGAAAVGASAVVWGVSSAVYRWNLDRQIGMILAKPAYGPRLASRGAIDNSGPIDGLL